MKLSGGEEVRTYKRSSMMTSKSHTAYERKQSDLLVCIVYSTYTIEKKTNDQTENKPPGSELGFVVHASAYLLVIGR